MRDLTQLNRLMMKGVILFIAVFGAFYFYQKPAVVTFDKAAVVKQFVTQLSVKKLTEEQTHQLSLVFAKALKDAIESYAQHHHVVVLKKDSAWGTGLDVTDVIALDIAQKMRDHS